MGAVSTKYSTVLVAYVKLLRALIFVKKCQFLVKLALQRAQMQIYDSVSRRRLLLISFVARQHH